ncbi:MAG: hypothetical protein KZQ90_11590 [Candidatus Thiodiazotropha sp. (ex Codakia rugifera)]|nr:hypothetical protein [Candidatus Thiodiazotropha sp. (ex Codakia rugifera)]
MTDGSKTPDPDRPVKLGDLLSVSISHEQHINELTTRGLDVTAQLEQQKIIDEVIDRFLTLTFDQLLRADVTNPDHMGFRITCTEENTGYEQFIKDLREKYFGPKTDDKIH